MNAKLNELLAKVRGKQGGFFSREDLQVLDGLVPSFQVLVRCGCGRFVTAVNSVSHFVKIIEAEGSDYVRDVCLLSDSDEVNKHLIRLIREGGQQQDARGRIIGSSPFSPRAQRARRTF